MYVCEYVGLGRGPIVCVSVFMRTCVCVCVCALTSLCFGLRLPSASSSLGTLSGWCCHFISRDGLAEHLLLTFGGQGQRKGAVRENGRWLLC